MARRPLRDLLAAALPLALASLLAKEAAPGGGQPGDLSAGISATPHRSSVDAAVGPVTALRGRVGAVLEDSAGRAHGLARGAYALAVDPLGRVFVADPRWDLVQAYEKAGALHWTVVGADPGSPGIRSPRGLALDGEGRLWVQSVEGVDIVTLSDSGPPSTVQIRRLDQEDLPRLAVRGAVAVEGGLRVGGAWPEAPSGGWGGAVPGAGGGPNHDFRVFHLTPQGVPRPLYRAPRLDLPDPTLLRVVDRRRPEAWSLPLTTPWTPRAFRALTPDGGLVQAVGSHYRIERLDPQGRPLPPIVGPAMPPVPVAPGELAAFEARLAELSARGLEVKGEVGRATKPPVRGLAVDERGWIWVEVARPAHARTRVAHVFDPDGRLRHLARWPSDVILLRGGSLDGLELTGAQLYRDHAWGIRVRPDGVREVVRIDWHDG